MGKAIAVVAALVLAAVVWVAWPDREDSEQRRLTAQRAAQQTAEAGKELLARTSYERAAENDLALLTQIRAVLNEQAPDLAWTRSEATEVAVGLCEVPYQDVERAAMGVFDVGEATGAIPEPVWKETERQVVEIAAHHGFTGVSLRQNVDDDRKLVIKNGAGGSVELQSVVNTTLAVYESCLLKGKGQ